jgi:DNA-binding response OmpR family regulator
MKRVLIVEDEPSIAASLEFLMRNCGFDTRVARDGGEALAWLAQYSPDLVLLDLMLPGMSGTEVCAAIRAEPRHAATRVLMLTANGAASVAGGALAGADEVLLKPFATREVVSRARALLGAPAA